MEAQRYPDDFDGIVAGAPAFAYQALNAAGTWNLQRIFRDNLNGNLAVDTTGDGDFDSLRLIDILHDQVLDKLFKTFMTALATTMACKFILAKCLALKSAGPVCISPTREITMVRAS
jgi:hypothetical protein